jgi:peptidoglycan/xylan/chitin deacetylase (PgdA/CDA1 family)
MDTVQREVTASRRVLTRTRVDGIAAGIKVLMYHNIPVRKSNKKEMQFAVQESSFRRQLELLERWNYTSITFEDLSLCLDDELVLPRKPVILTFDDAYADVYDVAFPLLREFGMKAVVFVLADRSIRTNAWDHDLGTEFPLVTDAQILEMKAAGFEIGSHTIHHPRLTSLGDKEAREEIIRSRIMLEILLNDQVRSISYPFGIVNDRVKQHVVEAGYLYGCGSWSGPALFGRDLFEIRRILVADTKNSLKFGWQLHPVYRYYRWFVWNWKHRLVGKDGSEQRAMPGNGIHNPRPDLTISATPR